MYVSLGQAHNNMYEYLHVYLVSKQFYVHVYKLMFDSLGQAHNNMYEYTHVYIWHVLFEYFLFFNIYIYM